MSSSLIGEAYVQLSANTKPLVTGINAAKTATKGFGAALKTALGPIALLIGGAMAFKELVGGAMDAEEADARLATTLKATGQEVENNTAKINAMSTALTRQTTLTDEQIKGAITTGLTMGLTAEQSQQAAKAAIGLARAYGMDVKDAMAMVSKEMQGVESRLGKQIPGLNECTSATARLAMIQKQAAIGFAQEEAQAATTKGSFERLHESLGILGDIIGGPLIKGLTILSDGLADMMNWLFDATEAATTFGMQGTESFMSVGTTFQMIGGIFQTIGEFFGEVLKQIIFRTLNWQLTLKEIGLTIEYVFMAGAGVIEWFGTQSWENVKWFFNNFTDIAKTAGSFIYNTMKNLVSNIGTLFGAIIEAIKTGSLEPFKNMVFKDMTEGFVNSVKEAPKQVDFGATVSKWTAGTSKAMAENDREFSKSAKKFDAVWDKTFAKNNEKQKMPDKLELTEGGTKREQAKLDKKAADEAKKNEAGTGGKTTGLVEAWKQMNEMAMKGNKAGEVLDVNKQMLDQLRMIAAKGGSTTSTITEPHLALQYNT